MKMKWWYYFVLGTILIGLGRAGSPGDPTWLRILGIYLFNLSGVMMWLAVTFKKSKE